MIRANDKHTVQAHAQQVQQHRIEAGLPGVAGAVKRWAKRTDQGLCGLPRLVRAWQTIETFARVEIPDEDNSPSEWAEAVAVASRRGLMIVQCMRDQAKRDDVLSVRFSEGMHVQVCRRLVLQGA